MANAPLPVPPACRRPSRASLAASLLMVLSLGPFGDLRSAEIRVISSEPSRPSSSNVLVIGQSVASNVLVLPHESASVLRLPVPPSPPAPPRFVRCFADAPSRLNLSAFRDEIAAASEASGVPEALIRAVIHAESAFQPMAVSHANAQGLMQLIPATAERFGVSQPFDPASNIMGGATYLAWLLRRFDGDLLLAAAGYNAGEGRVDQYGGVPPFSETQTYVQRVQALFAAYNRALTGRLTLTLTDAPRTTSC